MGTRPYLKPPWMQRHVGNKMSVLFRPSLLSTLSIPGRRSGRWHSVPVAVLEHGGERYLVSYRGVSDWSLNLQVSRSGRLSRRGVVEEIAVSEVPVAQRAELLEVYLARYRGMPTVAKVLRALPDPADHPMFRIITPARAGGGGPPAAG